MSATNENVKRTWTWRHAIAESNMSSTTRLVLWTISLHMNDVGEGCFPSTKRLARESGLSERAVCSHIAIASDLGWLTVSQHGFRGRNWKQNEYRPKWPDPQNYSQDGTEKRGTEGGSVAHQRGTEPDARGTEPDDNEALNDVQSNFSLNTSTHTSNACARDQDVSSPSDTPCAFVPNTAREKYSDPVERFIDPLWSVMAKPSGVENPYEFCAKLAKALQRYDPDVLDAAADDVLSQRSVFPNIAQAKEFCSKAAARLCDERKKRESEAMAEARKATEDAQRAKAENAKTFPKDSEQFQAWLAYDQKNNPNYAVLYANRDSWRFESEWPPELVE